MTKISSKWLKLAGSVLTIVVAALSVGHSMIEDKILENEIEKKVDEALAEKKEEL